MKILLDTNAYSRYKKGDPNVINEVSKSKNIFISQITVGELYSGFFRGDKFQKNSVELDEFLKNGYVKLAEVLRTTAKIYGRIYSILLEHGTPIPTNDIWIAACAIETDSTLVTYDKHFLKIPGLKLWKHLK